MILQNMVLPEIENISAEIYYRSSSKLSINRNEIILEKDTIFSTDTYMNSFDVGAWKKYTKIKNLVFRFKIKGKGKLVLFSEHNDGELEQVSQLEFDCVSKATEYYMKLTTDILDGVVYFKIQTETLSTLYSVSYETTDKILKDIKLSIVICTYKRQRYLEQLLTRLYPLIEKNSWIKIKVVDNASELSSKYGENIQVYHNPNTGGSGGFSRGMDETVNDLKKYSATHVVLMDDDVMIQAESFVRLYALLSFIKKGYENEVVAGRMFRLDKPQVQYTACEIWNAGDIKHIGWNQDMTVRDRLFDMNINMGGEYSGWWFACFPIDFVKANRPLPFFLHCDDVEYGLRHGGTPIVMNGIQVWHETYEYRQSPIVMYYDIRNTLIVNAMLHPNSTAQEVTQWWKRKISEEHKKRKYLNEYMMILGMNDYLKGKRYLITHNCIKKNKKLKKKNKVHKYKNSILWRLVKYRCLLTHSSVKKGFTM